MGETYHFWPTSESLGKVKIYLEVGIPGTLMICFEWWCFEILTIFSGLMTVESLSAEIIIVNLIGLVFMIPLGISYAASALTGNKLGQGKVD